MFINPHTNYGLIFSQSQHRLFYLVAILCLLLGGCNATRPSYPQPKQHGSEKPATKAGIAKTHKDTPPFGVDSKRPLSEERISNTVLSSNTTETQEMVTQGKHLYQKHCSNCHGLEGDGQGPVAADLSTRPQNFTKGVYKFRSTPSGELPTDADLLRTITVGIPGTAMENYQDLRQKDRLALVAYLKILSPRFLKRPQGTPIIFPTARPLTLESVNRGKRLYREMHCAACHGETGRGDGELAAELTDTTGETIRPADLTRGKLKSGKGPKPIYRTIMTGLDGTPMPSYGDSLDPEEGWDLALYIFSLSTPEETR